MIDRDPTTSRSPEARSAGRPPRRETSDERASWRAVAVPSEHGGWGLTLEPVVLGLFVAPSLPGAAIGVAAVLSFIARTPLKVVLVDRWRGRSLRRTVLARRFAVVEVVLVAGCFAVAAVTATGPFWIPLLIAAPLIGVELWFDMRSRSRRLVPELAGSIGIASVAAAIVLADGGEWETAAGAWLALAARSVASVPFVRTQLLRGKELPYRAWTSDVAQVVAVLLAAAGLALGWLPWASLVVIALVAVVQAVWLRTTPPKAAMVGAQQVVVGLTVVLVTALGILAP